VGVLGWFFGRVFSSSGRICGGKSKYRISPLRASRFGRDDARLGHASVERTAEGVKTSSSGILLGTGSLTRRYGAGLYFGHRHVLFVAASEVRLQPTLDRQFARDFPRSSAWRTTG